MQQMICTWVGVSCTVCGGEIRQGYSAYAPNPDRLRNGGGTCAACYERANAPKVEGVPVQETKPTQKPKGKG